MPFGLERIRQHEKALHICARRIEDRTAFLCERAAGKRVLDVGIVDHTYGVAAAEAWLHGHLMRSAAYILGIDILGDQIDLIARDGYNVRAHDLTKKSLDERFDLVVMGELIEHVDNPQSLLANAAACLVPGGTILLTTPNPWYINTVLRAMRGGFFVDNVDHVAWFDPSTMLALARRCNLTMVLYAGITGMSTRTARGAVLKPIVRGFASTNLFPLIDCKSILYELKSA